MTTASSPSTTRKAQNTTQAKAHDDRNIAHIVEKNHTQHQENPASEDSKTSTSQARKYDRRANDAKYRERNRQRIRDREAQRMRDKRAARKCLATLRERVHPEPVCFRTCQWVNSHVPHLLPYPPPIRPEKASYIRGEFTGVDTRGPRPLEREVWANEQLEIAVSWYEHDLYSPRSVTATPGLAINLDKVYRAALKEYRRVLDAEHQRSAGDSQSASTS